MNAAPRFPPSPPARRDGDALARLRSDLARRFPGAIVPQSSPSSRERLRDAAIAWVEVGVGQGGLSWLAAWTLLRLANDPLGRPALWVDTHCTLTPGDLLDLQGRLVVVRPADPHEAHVAADVALRSGAFSLVALEMHRSLHPTPLARLARLAAARHGEGRTPLVVFGEPPAFVGPPSGVPRTSFVEALGALFSGASDVEHVDAPRTPHTTDRLRPLDRAADRRPPPPPPRSPRAGVDDARAPLLPFASPTGPSGGARPGAS